MNNLVLVRHGQSQWNLERRFTGFYDIDLTQQGKNEAEYAGQLIKKLNIEFDTYFTSELKRAANTLNIILNILNKKNIEINQAWELNERHYGGLTGLNKDETIKKYGAKQVQIWRRSFDISPPPIESEHPYKNEINSTILCESLKDTFDRVIPFYLKNIYPLIKNKENVLIVAHGNSLRALCKNIFGISEKNIINFEIPTGNPLLIKFDNKLKTDKFFYLDKERSKNLMIKN